MSALLDIAGLEVTFDGGVAALRGLDLSLQRGESLAIVGESGAGKSTVAACLAGLVQPPQASGHVAVDGHQLLGAPTAELNRLRWATVAVGLQGAAFNPVATIRAQLAEVVTAHRDVGRAEANAHAEQAAARLGLEPAWLERYPHQLSGGQQRLALVAMVLTLDPPLVVLDEPTAGLDPHSKRELIERLHAAMGQRPAGLIVTTHDLGDATRLAGRTLVLYAGEAMESGPTRAVLTQPAHPYTWALVNAYPVTTTTKDLRPIRGHAPDPRAIPPGCPFHPRCPQAEAVCREERVALEPPAVWLSDPAEPAGAHDGRRLACHLGGLKPLLTATEVAYRFPGAAGEARALDGVSLTLRHGEAVGVIGPSGSGKTTLARVLTGDLAPEAGEVILDGQPLSTSWRASARAQQRRVQLIAQSPRDAISPRLTVDAVVAEPLAIQGRRDEAERRTGELLDAVGLPTGAGFRGAHADELSEGQLQRVAVARALAADPQVLVADEPTASLDASEQARLLVLLRQLQVEAGLALAFVSHDVAVVRKVTDRLVVLDAGRVVEHGPTHVVATRPRSATTRQLLEAAPALEPDGPGQGHADDVAAAGY